MTQTHLLEKRKKSLEQKKNRLKQLEASLNTQERKKRTRHMIELGGLLSKAHLDGWSSNTLFGALLFLKEKESDKNQMATWTHTGGAAFAAEKTAMAQKRPVKGTPVIVKFSSSPEDDIRASLKSLGLKWNALRHEWEGYAVVEELHSLLIDQDAEITKILTD